MADCNPSPSLSRLSLPLSPCLSVSTCLRLSPPVCLSQSVVLVPESVFRDVSVDEKKHREVAPALSGHVPRYKYTGTTTVVVLRYYARLQMTPPLLPQVCGSLLSCGNHTCEVLCHDGACPPCPRSVSRACPCGKTSEQIHINTKYSE